MQPCSIFPETQTIPKQYNKCNEAIPQVTHAKFLGVTFACDLAWNRHVQSITTKAACTLNFIRRNFKQAPQAVRELLYSTTIRPILEYGCTVISDRESRGHTKPRCSFRYAQLRISKQHYSDKRFSWLACACVASGLFRMASLKDVYFNRTPLKKGAYLVLPTYISHRLDHTLKIREIPARTTAFMNSFFPRTIKSSNQLPGTWSKWQVTMNSSWLHAVILNAKICMLFFLACISVFAYLLSFIR